MRTITLEELLEAGCHFGHQLTRQNPKARDFVFEARDNIHIIDLAKTKEGLEEAAEFVKTLASKPETTMVILGAKRQAQGVVKQEIARAKEAGAAGLFSVTNRWIGGTFTNFNEVLKNYRKLKDLTARLANEEERAGYTKKEISLWERERTKLENFYGGMVDITRIPEAIFIIDTHQETLAVKEAIVTGVKTVGIVDTNANPEIINYPIPANDDAVGSIELITNYIVNAWIEGKKKSSESKAHQPADGSELKKEEKKDKKPAKKSGESKETKEMKETNNSDIKKVTGEMVETKKKVRKLRAKKEASRV